MIVKLYNKQRWCRARRAYLALGPTTLATVAPYA